MQVISKVKLREFWERHPDAKKPLADWYNFVSRTSWKKLIEVQSRYPNDVIVHSPIQSHLL